MVNQGLFVNKINAKLIYIDKNRQLFIFKTYKTLKSHTIFLIVAVLASIASRNLKLTTLVFTFSSKYARALQQVGKIY